MTRRRSRPSGKPSTTSQRTSSPSPTGRPGELTKLIAELPHWRLENVFTHSSWAPDRASSYERLEFLGDSVLELALGDLLAERGARLVPEDELKRLARNGNVLAALLEASLAGVYLEHGFEAVEASVVEAFEGRIAYALTSYVDHKTELQEELARRGRQVSYSVLDVKGPPHDRMFTCA